MVRSGTATKPAGRSAAVKARLRGSTVDDWNSGAATISPGRAAAARMHVSRTRVMVCMVGVVYRLSRWSVKGTGSGGRRQNAAARSYDEERQIGRASCRE